jgi:flavodoxin
MARILLLYGSNSGNTEYAANYLAESLAGHDLSVQVRNVAEVEPAEVWQADLLIIGSPTWNTMVNGRYKEGQLQDQMATFLSKLNPAKLAKMPVAIFGLGDSQYQYFCGAAVLLQKFVARTGAHLVTDPLYLDGYPQFQPEPIAEWAAQLAQSWHEYQFIKH